MDYNSTGFQAPVNEMRIVLLGKTGSGKSKTGNTILGDAGFFDFGSYSDSVTAFCLLRSEKRFDKKLDVVDTPGVFDTRRSNADIQNEIKRCITLTTPGPNAVILNVKIGRYTEEDNEALKHFVKYFGEELLKYAIIIFTHYDQWLLDNKSSRKPLTEVEYIQNIQNEDLRTFIQKCENRYCFFNNRLEGNEQEAQVKGLLTMIDEMVKKNNHACYRNTDYEKVERLLQEELASSSPMKTRDQVKQSQSFFEKVLAYLKSFIVK